MLIHEDIKKQKVCQAKLNELLVNNDYESIQDENTRNRFELIAYNMRNSTRRICVKSRLYMRSRSRSLRFCVWQYRPTTIRPTIYKV